MLLQPRQLLLDRALHRLAVDFADLGNVFYDIHPRLLSQTAATMHEEIGNLQAEKRAMGVTVVHEDRPEGGYLARLTIDNAAKLNSLNRALMVEIVDAVKALEADSALRLVVVTGAGERAFIGGADIAELAT